MRGALAGLLLFGSSGCIWLTDAQLEQRLDQDADGVSVEVDCDDHDPDVGSEATVYLDRDGDGFGDPDQSQLGCSTDDLWVPAAGDCDDADEVINPLAVEVCDEVDDDCDGETQPCAGELADAPLVLYGRPGAGAGSTFATEGDLTGDGSVDLIVGAWQDDENGAESGAVYVVSGPLASRTTSLPAAAYAVLRGEQDSGMALGARVAASGDVDGDGYADLAVGAHKLDITRDDQGGVWLVNGPISAGDAELGVSVGSSWYSERSYDRTGWDLTLQDLDGDLASELIIGVYGYDIKDEDGTMITADVGRVYVVPGGGEDYSGSHSLAESGHVYLEGDAENLSLGSLVHPLPDLDGDGVSELALGCPDDGQLGAAAGAVYLLFGVPESSATISDVAMVILGREAGAGAGMGVGAAGDADGDGDDDLWIGESGADDNGADAGAVVLAQGPFGPSQAALILDDSAVRVLGTEEGDQVGADVAGGVDLNGDEAPDLIVGAVGTDSALGEVGSAWIAYGPLQGTAEYGDSGQLWWGATDHGNAGRPVRLSVALSSDDSPWLLIGAPGDDLGGDGAGAVFGIKP